MMVAQKFGSADPDMSSRVGGKGKTKEISDKSAPSVTARGPYTGLIGGPSNATGNTSEKKSGAKMSFARGGKIGGIAPYEEGGFRNAAMEHKR
jgi:hypothetical protein